jgi:hypothetical protein
MFEVETVKALVRDYDLVDSDEFEENIRTFLTHIGASYTLCWSPGGCVLSEYSPHLLYRRPCRLYPNGELGRSPGQAKQLAPLPIGVIGVRQCSRVSSVPDDPP